MDLAIDYARKCGTALDHINHLLKLARQSPEPADDWERNDRATAIERAQKFLKGDYAND